MKKIYSLALICLLAVSASAQRSMDLEVTLLSPTSSTVIESGKSFDILAVVKNLGPDSLKQAGDSILWFVTLDGTALNFPVGGNSGTTWLRYNRGLMVGDTLHFNFPGRSITYSTTADASRSICFNALPRSNKGGVDTIGDPQLNNNSGCVTLTFKASSFPAAVGELFIAESAVSQAVVYPNPAASQTTVHVRMQYNENVQIKVLDLTGRTVINKENIYMEKGDHKINLDVNSLQPGMYMYQVIMGKDVASGKLMVK